MRFHVGFSFRLKNIVKFIVPILIGIAAYFGIPGLFGAIQVKALDDFNNYYDMTINENLSSSDLDKLHDIVDLESDYYNIVIFYSANNYYQFVLIPKNINYYYLNIYGSYNSQVYMIGEPNYRRYYFPYNFTSNIEGYSDFVSCYVDNDNCTDISYSDVWSNVNEFNDTINNYCYYCILEDNDYDFEPLAYIYYSNIPIMYEPSTYYDPDAILKSLKVNNQVINVGDEVLTYNDLYDHYVPSSPTPPGPDDPEPSDRDITDYVYWFYDNFTEYDILINIYILLWFYVLFTLFIKIIAIIKGVKW